MPAFFQFLSRHWPGKVFIITYRKDLAKAQADVAKFGIRYDELILVDSFAAKAEVIAANGISVYVDDQDEILQHVPKTVTVFKIRNGGNYDFDLRGLDRSLVNFVSNWGDVWATAQAA